MCSQTNKCKAEEDTDGGAAKRHEGHEATLNDIADEYICLITTELPLDPVTAMDGRIYERSAIEALIAKQGYALRSPITNDPMGPQLLPAVQARNTIELLVRSGALDGDKARRWKKRLDEERKVASLRKEAEKGDIKAMCELGYWFSKGNHGLKKDDGKAYEWYRKAADQHYPPAMARAARHLLLGVGVEKSVTEGVALMGMAAQGGSANAAYHLGLLHSQGLLPKNMDRARYWLKKALDGSGEFDDMPDVFKTDAKKYLDEQLAGNPSDEKCRDSVVKKYGEMPRSDSVVNKYM